jgi:hypothetical protein
MNVGFSNINAKADGIKGRPAFSRHSSGGAVSGQSITSISGRRP